MTDTVFISRSFDKCYAIYMGKENLLSPWKLLHQEIVFETPWFKIEKQDLKMPNGATPTFYIHDTLDSVMCVCVTKNKMVLIERQYRPAMKRVSVDYPAGRLDENDNSIEDAMLRELMEETGYETTEFKKIAVIDKDPGFSKTKTHIYLAEGIIPGTPRPEITESITSELVPAEKIIEMIFSGEMNCASCVSATLFAFKELGWLGINLN
jgi:ADP-ribose pyrophosphatase